MNSTGRGELRVARLKFTLQVGLLLRPSGLMV